MPSFPESLDAIALYLSQAKGRKGRKAAIQGAINDLGYLSKYIRDQAQANQATLKEIHAVLADIRAIQEKF